MTDLQKMNKKHISPPLNCMNSLKVLTATYLLYITPNQSSTHQYTQETSQVGINQIEILKIEEKIIIGTGNDIQK